MKVGLLFCALLLTGCALSETEVKTEAKVRFDKVYPVELAHYEYEERLQTFYDAEEILPEHLGRLYRGEFPNGETFPNKLRIHWTNARALAQAEVELQKDILGWAGADVSPRPILVNDPNEKFYRYYEYRVLKGGKEVGAVRIPAYRRTENFATAEVHQYNGDASQYTLKPTGWGEFFAVHSALTWDENFMAPLMEQIYPVLSENYIYNNIYALFMAENKYIPESVGVLNTYAGIKDTMYTRGNFPKIKKGGFSGAQKEMIVDSYARQNADTIYSQIKPLYSTVYALAVAADNVDKLKPMVLFAQYFNLYLAYQYSLDMVLTNMSLVSKNNNQELRKQLSDIYWEDFEEFSTFERFKILTWDLSKKLSDKGLKPLVQYPKMAQYPDRDTKKQRYGWKFSEFTLVGGKNNLEYSEPSIAFVSGKNQKIIQLYNNVEQVGYTVEIDGVEKSKLMPLLFATNSSQTSRARAAKPMDGEDIEHFLQSIFQNKFGEMSREMLKASIINYPIGDTTIGETLAQGGSLLRTVQQIQGVVGGIAFGIVGPAMNLLAPGLGSVITAGLIPVIQDLLYGTLLDKFSESIGDFFDSFDVYGINIFQSGQGLIFIYDVVVFLNNEIFKNVNSTLEGDIKITLNVIGQILQQQIDGVGINLEHVLAAITPQWVVWVIPILPFPTWVHYTKKWGSVPSWMMRLGVPAGWWDPAMYVTKDLPYYPPKLDKIESIVESLIPDKIKDYAKEWMLIYNWLMDNQVFTKNNEESVLGLSDDDLGEITLLFVDEVYDMFAINTKLVYIDKAKPIEFIKESITNIVDTKTNITENNIVNIISNPSASEKLEQLVYDINTKWISFISLKYGVTLSSLKIAEEI